MLILLYFRFVFLCFTGVYEDCFKLFYALQKYDFQRSFIARYVYKIIVWACALLIKEKDFKCVIVLFSLLLLKIDAIKMV